MQKHLHAPEYDLDGGIKKNEEEGEMRRGKEKTPTTKSTKKIEEAS